MNINQLEYGKAYKVVCNAGYFDHICYLQGFTGGFAVPPTSVGHRAATFVAAVLKDEKGQEHFIHTQDFWRDDNPVYISYLLPD
jgi:hypothetical protein